MTIIDEKLIKETSEKLYVKAAIHASPDGVEALKKATKKETDPSARERLETILRNIELAEELGKPMCQTFATPAAYIKLGTEAKVRGDLYRAIAEGVSRATDLGYLRPSIVEPISRIATGGNTGRYIPNVEIELMNGADYLDITVHCTTELPPSNVKVLYPYEIGEDGIGVRKFVVDTVMKAGGVACPPMAVGVGVGGSLDIAARLSKIVSLSPWTNPNPDPLMASWEENLLRAVNRTNIGPFGLGGDTTAIAVKVDIAHAHAADLPVAVNLFCWACTMRKASAKIHADGHVEYQQP
ncbi:MAG: fumarate hydratase [Nitrososphaeria archaeon]|nr:fumarate hydratase [Nitrososphaeria archaeon]NIN52423.1 fumarate hydratase [Nitrososphaeria archaeon]NIQ32924.1 fumarate hydratase [Nitrososphaeria archaeon]